MKKLFFLLSLALVIQLNAQKITKENFDQIQQIELSIKDTGKAMVMSDVMFNRFKADSFFTRGLVQALKVPNSFYYPFDSLITISKLYAPDSSFRIFTWQVMKDESYYRQRGAIQIFTKDGSLKLIPLFDMSDFTNAPTDSVRDNQRWIGAIYYNCLLNTYAGKKYYTLLGFDDNNSRSNKKWIDVLTFDETGKPQFGGRYFQYQNDSIKPNQPAYRFCLEYKKDAKTRMNYDPELQMIVFDHLISEDNDLSEKFSLIPDGSYEAFKWGNGKWIHVPMLAVQKVDMRGVDPMLGNAPGEAPIFDKDGKIDQKKLDEQNKKNQQIPPKKGND
ncbi:hypothetical protein ACI6Q2_22615 [Chitinophagaceae bacterium LWZ2-11]